ncbi:MAG: hypothetical protein AAB682_01540, partial [Patescibacteria group bacterium]
MIRKQIEKDKAIELRRAGKTYGEILKAIPVAKSTLAIWLHSVGMAKSQKQRYTELKKLYQKKGAEAKRRIRIELSTQILKEAEKEIGSISDRELWLIGTTLYWAEGSKQKAWNVSEGVQFTNSDPLMIKLFILWLTRCLKTPESDIVLSLAIHENNKHRLASVIEFWHEQTGFRWDISDRIYFKRHKPKVGRYNLGDKYYGTLRIVVRSSTNLNR